MYATVIPAGTLTIRAASDDAMSCELWLNDDFVGSSLSADAAAQSVSHHSSGCDLIDEGGAELPQAASMRGSGSACPRRRPINRYS